LFGVGDPEMVSRQRLFFQDRAVHFRIVPKSSTTRMAPGLSSLT
jgi:hypothetical protein